VITPTPGNSLRGAGIVVALLSGLLGAILFLFVVQTVDRVATPVPAYDDVPWLALNPPEIPTGSFELMTGQTPQQVIQALGPPIRVRRDAYLPTDCEQAYVYATRVLGKRTTEGVCFNTQGRAASFLGQTVSFDLRRMGDQPGDGFIAAGLLSLILTLPLAIVFARRRRWPQRLTVVSLTDERRAPSKRIAAQLTTL
jgi:hypothetical protein